ncbi:MAG: hypothetical protein H6581_29635 [Bacteroidia bacterium]|nr:hypothetical protein [Bacteroidia bacterium]
MIESRPKSAPLYALGIFLLIVFGVIGMVLYFMATGPRAWYHYLLLAGMLPVGIGVLAKVVGSNKILFLDKDSLTVRFPLRFSKRVYTWKSLQSWEEILIPTKSSDFKVLEMVFERGAKISLSATENSHYEEIKAFLQKRFGKQKPRSGK